jgi:2'-5' RNA ligase
MRLFIALPIPEEVRERIVADTAFLRGKYPRLKWLRQDALHLTLSFLGEVEEDRIDFIHGAMRQAAERTSAYGMELEGMGAFPKRGAPRVLYLPVTKGEETTRMLQSVLVQALGDLGKRDRKKFTPHLTIARVKGRHETPDPREAGEGLSFGFDQRSVVLYRSHLDPKGARYERLKTVELAEST